MNAVTIIESVDLDTTLRIKEMSKPGGTIRAIERFAADGGKEADQTVAAKRSSVETYLIGAVGNDGTGVMMTDLTSQGEINLTRVTALKKVVTGQVLVIVDNAGENSIMIYTGVSNASTSKQAQGYQEIIERSNFMIVQFENTADGTIAASEIAKEAGVKTILNPAPALE